MVVTTVRDARAAPADLAQTGAVFNETTRLLDGGFWDNQIAYTGMYTTDIHAVLNDINAMLANPGSVTVGGAALTLADADTAVLKQVQGQLETLVNLAPGSTGNGADAATNQDMIHTTQTSTLDEIDGDAAHQRALAGETCAGDAGADDAGFQAPAGADDAASPQAASDNVGQDTQDAYGSGGQNAGGQDHFGHGHEARPVPSFWNFDEGELEHTHEHANNNHHRSELMWHHA